MDGWMDGDNVARKNPLTSSLHEIGPNYWTKSKQTEAITIKKECSTCLLTLHVTDYFNKQYSMY